MTFGHMEVFVAVMMFVMLCLLFPAGFFLRGLDGRLAIQLRSSRGLS